MTHTTKIHDPFESINEVSAVESVSVREIYPQGIDKKTKTRIKRTLLSIYHPDKYLGTDPKIKQLRDKISHRILLTFEEEKGSFSPVIKEHQERQKEIKEREKIMEEFASNYRERSNENRMDEIVSDFMKICNRPELDSYGKKWYIGNLVYKYIDIYIYAEKIDELSDDEILESLQRLLSFLSEQEAAFDEKELGVELNLHEKQSQAMTQYVKAFNDYFASLKFIFSKKRKNKIYKELQSLCNKHGLYIHIPDDLNR